MLRSVPVGSCCSSHLSCAPELSSHGNRDGGVDVYSCALSWGEGGRQSEPATETTQKLSRIHRLTSLPLTEMCWSKEVIIKYCKIRNCKALRGKKEIKQARKDLEERTIKMQNELHSICKINLNLHLLSVLQQSVIRTMLTAVCCWYRSQELILSHCKSHTDRRRVSFYESKIQTWLTNAQGAFMQSILEARTFLTIQKSSWKFGEGKK